MPNDIAERLRSLIEMSRARRDPVARMEMPSMPERDFGAPAFPEIETAMKARDADYVNPFGGPNGATNVPVWEGDPMTPKPQPKPAPVPYFGKRFGAG